MGAGERFGCMVYRDVEWKVGNGTGRQVEHHSGAPGVSCWGAMDWRGCLYPAFGRELPSQAAHCSRFRGPVHFVPELLMFSNFLLPNTGSAKPRLFGPNSPIKRVTNFYGHGHFNLLILPM